MSNGKPLAILAVGGNSLIADEAHKSVEDQYQAIEETCRHIAGLLARGWRVVVTHGNGPQVGFILRRSELSRHELHDVPLDSCGADTQGAIGYQIQKAMYNEMKAWPVRPEVATVVTQVLVDREDPAFKQPSKPIGSFMDEKLAAERRDQDGWDVVEDAGRGWRRVIASPRPVRILELEAIRRLLEHDIMVVAAVIDKDLATSLLARELGADLLIISTAIEQAYLDFKKPGQRPIARMTVAEAKRYLAEGHFAPGSMKPKIEAVVEFLEAGGKQALITDPPHLLAALEGRTGTWVVA
jgi:carbamate kinase